MTEFVSGQRVTVELPSGVCRDSWIVGFSPDGRYLHVRIEHAKYLWFEKDSPMVTARTENDD